MRTSPAGPDGWRGHLAAALTIAALVWMAAEWLRPERIAASFGPCMTALVTVC